MAKMYSNAGDIWRTSAALHQIGLASQLTNHPIRRAEHCRRSARNGNTGYTLVMAKVMVSLPDDLLKELDAEAARRGLTRSGMLRELADQALRDRGEHRSLRVAATVRGASHHGGDVSAVLRRHRPAR